MPTGFACAGHEPPKGAVANVLHALTLLIARQMTNELESIGPDTERWIADGGPQKRKTIPDEMQPHNH